MRVDHSQCGTRGPLLVASPAYTADALRHRHRSGRYRWHRPCATCLGVVSQSSARYDPRTCDPTAFVIPCTATCLGPRPGLHHHLIARRTIQSVAEAARWRFLGDRSHVAELPRARRPPNHRRVRKPHSRLRITLCRVQQCFGYRDVDMLRFPLGVAVHFLGSNQTEGNTLNSKRSL